MCSHLSDRTLFVAACSGTSSQRPFTAGIPQGGIWCFNLCTHHLLAHTVYCDLFTFADSYKSAKDIRIIAGDKMTADLGRIYS